MFLILASLKFLRLLHFIAFFYNLKRKKDAYIFEEMRKKISKHRPYLNMLRRTSNIKE